MEIKLRDLSYTIQTSTDFRICSFLSDKITNIFPLPSLDTSSNRMISFSDALEGRVDGADMHIRVVLHRRSDFR